jgi:hypothetical protein
MAARAGLMGLSMAMGGMALHAAANALILHQGRPALGHLVAMVACYLATGFAFALGYCAVSERLPGRGWAGRGLSYTALVLLVIWIGGNLGMLALDLDGGWNLASPARIPWYWAALCDWLNILFGGLLMGFISRRDDPGSSAPRARSPRLAVRVIAGAALLPSISAATFFLAARLLPLGIDLAGERRSIFYVFVFAPLAISGAGTALFHEALRIDEGSGRASRAASAFSTIYILFWLTDNSFIVFLGFAWQTLLDFLLAGALALYLTLALLEAIARPRAPIAAAERAA